MALFKVSKGLKANLPSAKTEGYCWYTTDDSLFYIDYKDENGSLQRKALNAKDAETLTGASLSTILNSSDVEIPTSKAVSDALNGKLDKVDAGSDWNQSDNTKPDYIKNRPFYEDIETVSTTVDINWDGTTTGLVTSVITYWDGSTEKGNYCKISDDIFTKEQFLQMYFVRDGSEITVTEDMLNFDSHVITYGADSSPVIVIEVGGGIPGGPPDKFTETGIYFPSNGCVTKLASRQPIESTTTTIKKIDEEFMPDSIIEAINSITNKMDTTNPVGTGSFSMNRKDGTTIGTKSHAEGNSTTASGDFSHAEGSITIASKESSHAEGSETVASGKYSHAEGFRTTSSGTSSHSEGYSSKVVPDTIKPNTSNADIITKWNTNSFALANGPYSHVEGLDNLSLGSGSHAEGTRTIASAESSHAEGKHTTASGDFSHAEGDNTTASGCYSHAEGNLTTASGSASHAEGNYTTASGSDSHAEGFQTTASGDYGSHAEGRETTASGYCSHAEGFDTKASSDYQHVQGKYNIEDSAGNYANIVGNGTADTARSNAHTLDWSGNAWYAGKVSIGTTSNVPAPTDVNDLVTKQYVDNKFSTKTASVTLVADSWTGTESPYSQVVTIDGVTANSKVDLNPTGEQLNSLAINRTILNTANDNGTVTVYAVGNKPTENYTMQVTITEV